MPVKRIFISYSRADYILADDSLMEDSPVGKIVASLKKCPDLEIWMDVEDHYSGMYFTKVLAEKIRRSDIVLFISSKNSNSSYWVSKEILYASENKKVILPVKIDNSDFCEDFSLILPGVDYIEYFKNESKAIEKLKRILLEEEPEPEPVTLWKKIRRIFGVIATCLLLLLFSFAVFATIGYAVGYISNRVEVDEVMEEAFDKSLFTIVDSVTVQYSGNSLNFHYDVADGTVIMKSENENMFENLTVEKALASVSISLAFNRMLQSSRYVQGRAKIVYIAVGTIGVVCGYTIGENIGKESAAYKNEHDLVNYFKKDGIREYFRKKLEPYR